MILEDNPTDLFVIKEVLGQTGLDLHTETLDNGGDALDYLRRVEEGDAPCPSVIMLDLNLPRIDGLELLRRLRDLPQCANIPVVIVTSSSADRDRAAANRLGITAYFEKPHDLSVYMELAQVIKRILRGTGGEAAP